MRADAIPEEELALKMGGPPIPGNRQLPPSVVNQLSYDEAGQQVLLTVDPQLASLGLPPYPALPANTDAGKVEEIRRTVYVGNLPKDVVPKQLVEFFTAYVGEVGLSSLPYLSRTRCIARCVGDVHAHGWRRSAALSLCLCRWTGKKN